DGKNPVHEKARKIYGANHRDTSHGNARAGKIREITVDAELDKFRAEQLSARGQDREDQIQDKGTAVWPHISRQTPERRDAHRLLGELLFEEDVVVMSHGLRELHLFLEDFLVEAARIREFGMCPLLNDAARCQHE